MTPETFCMAFPEAARADCIGAGELLSAPRDRTEPDVTLRLTADDGRLSAAYESHCFDGDTILLPADEEVRLQFTSRDAVYGFRAPGLVEPIDLVPGRVNDRLVRTPSTPGPIKGELRADGDEAARQVLLQVVAADGFLGSDAICD